MKLVRGKGLCASVAILAAAGAMCGMAASAQAGSDSEFAAAYKNPDLWPGMGHDLGLNRHSDLSQINMGNIDKLQGVWSQSTGALRGHEGQPIVIETDGKPMM